VAACEPGASPAAMATLKDFTIELDNRTVAAGAVVIQARNEGTLDHEIVVVKDVAPEALPIKDGKVDEEQLPAGSLIGEIEAFAPGASCAGRFDTVPGRYTLFCNVVDDDGQSHERKGMVTTLTVHL
jgi:hypothetical protein